jgi:hypothetical protein
MPELHIYACVDLEIQAPAGFQVNTDMDAGWRPRFIEGDITVLDADSRLTIDEYDDGPLKIRSTLVRLCPKESFESTEPVIARPYQRLAALIQLGAAGRAAHRQAIDKLGDEIIDIVFDKHGDDPVTAFRVKDAVKRYAS